ncbi:hypothetical protein IB257_30255 [Achromobacter sp. ACM03]|uniref:hypothetical protein n=1 Tax=Achromobacter TaxID=222 RepID=UPI000F7373D0|nr:MULTISPECIES: hypothetical protein [Achromobacter]MBD9434240.1 hypothetical protein [Achromobacter sp. ACM03]MBD9476197.1 hypothetical protein [Achromobacter sp. ACM01]RSF02733.1 hypothetical protein EGU54_12595 [Achromobacter aegrifaciens]CAB3897822.1 hypothetical protein LMG26854_05339 [Achromobacter aegrifaciens]
MAVVPLEIWDQNGIPLFQFGTKVARQFGSFDTGTVDSYNSIPTLGLPKSWYVCSAIHGGLNLPIIKRNGAVISWEFMENPNEARASVRVYYGLE